MNGSAFEAPTLGIGRLLSEGSRFVVPHHQRDYRWTADEIDQLFADIKEARSSDQEEYFIGLMVFMPGGTKEFTILDGQQRLATTVIILSAIRAWLKARGVDRDADQIQSTYIAVRELGRDDFEPRLVLNENNNPAFKKFVVHESPISEIQHNLNKLRRYDPNRRLLEAILLCRQKIDELAGSPEGTTEKNAERLFDLVRFFQDRVKIVRLTVSNEANAYTVFETLNDRGLDLSVLDLVKNYIFGRAVSDERLRQVQTHWTQMMANLANVRADDFLKSWWTSRYGRIQKAQLFPKFRSNIVNWRNVSKTSSDMLVASEHYAALEIADDPLWSDISESSRDSIRALKLLGAKQVHPVLLSALVKFTNREQERLLRLLEVLIVRYQLIGGGRTGRLEITCSSLAGKIWHGDLSTTKEALEVVKTIFPTDSDFGTAFKTKQERNNRKAAYILRRLESQARQAKRDFAAKEFEASKTLTLEHILPKNPGASWKIIIDDDETISEECTFRIGNLCLLSGINRKIGNKSFAEKKKIYTKSDLLMTRSLGEFEHWNRDAVEKRQNQMAKLAVSYWRFE